MADWIDQAFRREDVNGATSSVLVERPAPDAAARANAVARRLNVPAETADRNLALLEQQVEAAKARRLFERQPKLAQWANNPRHAAVAADDMDQLDRASRSWQRALSGTITATPDPLPSIGNIFTGWGASLAAGIQGVRQIGSDYLAGIGIGAPRAPGVPQLSDSAERETTLRQTRRSQARVDATTPAFKSRIAAAVYGGVSSAVQQAPGIAAAIATRNPALALGYAGGTVGTSAYGKYRGRGATIAEATVGGLGEGGVEAATELIPMARFIGAFGADGAKGFMRGVVRSAIADIPGEQVATVAQDAIDTAIANPEKTWADYAAERPGAALDTLIATVTQSVITGGAGAAIHRVMKRSEQQERARAEAESVSAAMDDAATSKTRARDPDAFQRFIEQHTEGSPIENVFVPAETVSRYFQEQDFDYRDDDFWGAYSDQIDEGIVTGGDVVIPTAAAAAHLSGTPVWEAIKSQVRTSAGGMSLAEADSLRASHEESMERLGATVAEQLAQDRIAAEPRNRIYQDIRDKLTSAGYSQDAADINAELVAQRYATRAERLGKPLVGDETARIDVNAVLPESIAPIVAKDAGDVALQSVINVMRGERGVSDAKLRGPTLLDWIAKQGGIEDKGGDLRAMGLGPIKGVTAKGVRKLIRARSSDQGRLLDDTSQQNANTPDELAMRAQEAGYFPVGERPTVNDLFEAIDRELRGTPTYVEHSLDVEAGRRAADDLASLLDSRGLDPATANNEEIRRAIDSYRQEAEATGRRYEQSLRSIRSGIGRLIELARKPGHNHEVVTIATASDWLVAEAKSSGLAIDGMTHTIDTAAVRHVMKRHGEAGTETSRGQLPIAEADLREIPIVIADADFIVLGLKNERGQDVIAYTRDMPDGTTLYLEEVRSGRKQLAAVTMRRFPGANDARRVASDPALYARSTPQGEVKVVEVPPAGKRRTLYQTYGAGPRGQITFGNGRSIIDLFESSNLSTFSHEMAHQWLEEIADDAHVSGQASEDWSTIQKWFADHGHPVEGGVIPVEAHEMWARGVERYLMEGRAPTNVLRRVFDAFRAWLLNIYQVVENLRAPITPEVRDVMTRLLATDEEIAEATAEQHLTDLFDEAASAGMTGAEFETYRALTTDARDEAHSALLYKTLSIVRAAKTKAWRDEEATVRAEVTERVNARPEFKALHLIRTGRMLDDPSAASQPSRLSRLWLVEQYGEGILSQLPRSVPPLYADTNTASADDVAERTGFASGDDMVRTLVTIEERKRTLMAADDKRSVRQALIDEETAQEMRDRHGDPLNDGSIEAEALAAVQSDAQGEKLAFELRVLSRRSSSQATPYSLAKRWAVEKIARGTVQESTSGTAVQRYSRAAAKAGRAAEAALIKRNYDEAFRQKQAQMLNNALVAEATRARDALEKARTRLSSYARRRTIKSMDQDYLEQIHALLQQVELKDRSQRSVERQASFEAWAAARTAEGHDVIVPESFASSLGSTHWSRLTVDQMLGLDATVQQIAHLGRFKQELLDGAERRAHDEVVSEALAVVEQMPERPPVQFDPSWSDRLKSGVAQFDAGLLKMESVVDWLDAGSSGGVFNRLVFKPIADAQAREQDMTADYFARIRDAMAEVPNVGRWLEKVTITELFDRNTARPITFTRQRLVAMALNVGNAGNLQRLTDGYGWNEETVLSVLNRELTADDWRFVQKVWDIVDTLWPEISAMERRVNGVEPEKVEARPVDTSAGTLRGGYYPAIYDTSRDLRAEGHAGKASDLLETTYTKATTRASSTKDRVEKVERPILLDIGVINRHLGEVIHDVTHREAIINADKFLNDARIQEAVNSRLGPEIRKQFRPWLKYVANQWAMERAGNEGVGRFIGKARANTTAVGMGFRLSTVMTQVAGYANSFEAVGVRWVAPAIAQMARSPIETSRFVMERSAEVRHRMSTLDRDLAAAIKAVDTNKSGLGKSLSILPGAMKFMYHGIGYMDRAVSVPTWIGAYNRALAEGATEDQAVYRGDKAVRQSQGAGGAKDLAAITRGNGRWGELLKISTMFYSYFSALYQRQRTLARDVGSAVSQRQYQDMPALLARAWWLVVMPPVLAEVLAGRGPDEDEDWSLWAFKSMIFNALGPIPFVRDIARPAWDKAVGDQSFGYSLSPLQRAGETIVNSIGDAGKIVRGEETKRATRNAMEATGYVTGLVPGQIATATQFLVDVAEGDQDPETLMEWYRGLSTGKTEPR